MAESLLMLSLSPTMENGQIIQWHKKEGEMVNIGDALCEVETDKASITYESQQEGHLLKILKKASESAAIGEAIAIIGEEGEDFVAPLESLKKQTNGEPKNITQQNNNPKAQTEQNINPTLNEQSPEKKAISPLARKLAKQHNINISPIQGSGPNNRIVKKDLQPLLSEHPDINPKTNLGINLNTNSNINQNTNLNTKDSIIKLSAKRQIIAKRLVESKYSMPHYYLKLSIQMDTLLKARINLNRSLENKVSLSSFLIKFVSQALNQHPLINSSFENNEIRIFHSIDIGLAVEQEDGLVTPIIRNCVSKGILAIDQELKTLIKKAKNNTLTPNEFAGASFTISNLGSFGVEEFTAIINPPGAAILAIGSIIPQNVVLENNTSEVKSLMKVTLSCDHRVIDGAMGARFLKTLKDIIENPIQILY